jgi:hypothetical protein
LKGKALKFKIESNFFSFLENFTFDFGSPCPRYLPEICPLHHKKMNFFDVQFVPKRTWQLSWTFVMRGIPAPHFIIKTPNASIRLHRGKHSVYQNPNNKTKTTTWNVNHSKRTVNRGCEKQIESLMIFSRKKGLRKLIFFTNLVNRILPINLISLKIIYPIGRGKPW